MSSERTEEKSHPLHKAIKCRNLVKINKLVNTVDINERNHKGYTPLIYACMQPKNDGILEILFQHDNIDPMLTDDEGASALHILAFNGQLKWIKRYFEKFPKVPVDILTAKKDTPLIQAAKMDNSSVILYLYENGANINHKNDKNFTALHYSANNGYLDSLELLISLGAEINACDKRDCTPLMKACSWGFTETCKLLLENGAKTNPTGTSLKYPLNQAIFRNHLDIVELLLHYGADPNLEIKVSEYRSYIPLGSACSNKHIEALKLLIKHKANINYPGTYSLPLFLFIKQDFVEGVQFLIDEGVNLHGRHPQSGKTAMEYAKSLRKNNIVQLLKKYY